MIKNYLNLAFRNIWRNKGFSFINISGLIIGMASALLILLWVHNELSYDRFHSKQDRLYQVWSNDTINGKVRSMTFTPEIMAPTLKIDYPEIEGVSRVRWTRNLLSLNTPDKKLLSTGAIVDQDFLSMFSFPLQFGNIKNVLSDPNSIVLTQQLATKLFKNENPIGKTVVMGNSQNYIVTGILKNLPNNTQFNFIEYLTSYDKETLSGNIDKDWSNFSVSTYVLLNPNTSEETINNKLKTIIHQHTSNVEKTEEFLYPVSQLWLYDKFENGKAVGGRIETIRVFILIAVFILLIACINFMNLSTARSEKRAREVGVRKVIGASKVSLIIQFMSESLLYAFISGVFALLVVLLVLPAFNSLVGKQLSIEFNNLSFWLSGIGFIMFTGILAGSYPAFFLSGFKPILAIKGRIKNSNTMLAPRKLLVVLQFTFAIVLIICTLVVTQQVKYGQQRKTGYDMNNLVHIILNDEMEKNFNIIKNDLLTSGYATSVTKTQSPLTENWSYGLSLRWQGKDPNLQVQVNRYTTEGDLVKTAGLKLIRGRDIDIKNHPSDSGACLINETAAKLMKFKDPIGQLIYDDEETWQIVGVIGDFIQESPYASVKPLIVKGPKSWMGTVIVKLNDNNSRTTNIAGMESIFKKYNPAYPLEFHFTDDAYTNKFNNEKLTGKLTALFSALAIFISCLGLFGLSAFLAENRFKEIGVRKVLGATVTSLTILLSSDFIKLVIVSIFIASPFAYFISNQWLKSFQYHIGVSIWIFIITGALAILIALLTVSYQAIKAALMDPVKSLKSE
ncbi:ABC transporter permease [Chitinophaga silvatica]|uniref:ABC transporter permease n=1 Tax=Chitinophaga silvatica TaxID=2282649 RepID=A0A3E1YEL1_9BACT|nr:ABC transporter permease [Chitinophaga silvatica]RFS24958.1 ABC transporter permease [Chitinophaga silvatica]